jgi:hypothetical protein
MKNVEGPPCCEEEEFEVMDVGVGVGVGVDVDVGVGMEVDVGVGVDVSIGEELDIVEDRELGIKGVENEGGKEDEERVEGMISDVEDLVDDECCVNIDVNVELFDTNVVLDISGVDSDDDDDDVGK